VAELANCSRCGKVFVKSIRDVCQSCHQEEEEAFRVVYRFLTKRENREATVMEVVKATGVEEELIIKFIKQRRLRTSEFPKLAYPCKRCGVDIVSGRLCANCAEELRNDLEQHEKKNKFEASRKDRHEKIYYSIDKHKK